MRAEETLKNRPLHELLNFDDEDILDRVNRQKRFEDSSNYGLSMSTVGALEPYFDEDDRENMQSESVLSISDKINRIDSEPSKRRRRLLAAASVAFIGTFIVALVKFIAVIPQINGMKNMPRTSDNDQVKLKKLKALSTGKLSFFII
jgi:hypothetical protein